MTALCQIWTGLRLVSELADSQRNIPVGKTRSVSGTGDYEISFRSDMSLITDEKSPIKHSEVSSKQRIRNIHNHIH